MEADAKVTDIWRITKNTIYVPKNANNSLKQNLSRIFRGYPVGFWAKIINRQNERSKIVIEKIYIPCACKSRCGALDPVAPSRAQDVSTNKHIFGA